MEAEEITKLVDGVYRNILDKFNPGARQLIAAGKSYLKALHGAATASRLFNEALAKIAMNAQQSGTGDIGSALMSVVNVNKEIQEQQMNILKAFYVDLLVPLETNLEKDTKVVQHEQKKFLQQHKVRMESYQKAVSTMKKQRKKKSSPENTEKELRSLQLLEDQKKKLDNFCDQSYKNAMTQERRRYGFVLERQCSIAKHWMAYHTTGKTVIDNNLENWQEIAASREIIPAAAYENSFNGNNNNSSSNGIRRLERIKDVDDDTLGAVGMSANNSGNVSAHLKKSRSIDAPYGDMRTLHERESSSGRGGVGMGAHYAQNNSLPRAKSDFNLATTGVANNSSSVNDHTDHHHHQQQQQQQQLQQLPHHGSQWDQRPVVKALYAYMPSGENQLPFDEGDRIALVGGKAKGWQFGENLRTQLFGWFPIAYTNAESSDAVKALKHERYENMQYERNGGMRSYHDAYMSETHMESDSTYRRRNHSAEESSPTRMFGDTINFKQQKKYRSGAGAVNPRPGPPPTLPAPVPSGQTSRMLNTSQSFCASNGVPAAVERRKQKLLNGAQSTMAHLNMSNQSTKPAAAAKTSLHSSNDSGFANEPPPQPEVDYSDEEQTARVPIRRRADTNTHTVPRDIASWTLNRNFRNSVDSQIDDKSLHRMSRQSGKMRYDLIASDDEILQASSTGLKRTKSFWKFGGGRSGEDILAGMSLWQHRDLVAAPNLEELRDEDYRRAQSGQLERERAGDEVGDDVEVTHEKNGTLTKSHNSNSSHEKRRKDSITSTEIYGDEDENIYGISPMHEPPQQQQQQQQQRIAHANYTPKSRMKIMKTIEIDIENPMDNERMSTIKRGQKAYQQEEYASDMRRITNGVRDLETKSNRNSMQQQQQQQRKQQQQQHSTPQLKSQSHTLTRGKAQEFPASTDEGESDEHGTLKMSDVNNFFDDLTHEHNTSGSGGGMIMKTVKRKDILKQYYTSEDESDDAELKSTSSDPYDCIVINDHLVRKDEKLRRHLQNTYQEQQHMEFQTFRASTNLNSNNNNNSNNVGNTGTTKKSGEKRLNGKSKEQEHERYQHNNNHNGSSTLTRNSTSTQQSNSSAPTATILPRTRLLKSSSSNNNNTHSMTLERNKNAHENGNSSRTTSASTMHSSDKDQHQQQARQYGKSYGPWYDFWDQQDHAQHGITSPKSTNAKLNKGGAYRNILIDF